ncbi:unnamed protein product [Medioppia subpectinata]|uniref:Vacuolar protein sorting-associated protein 72 homolog n=1 Tax=Medioppia subpectinata TaxID=1979941 RepID=A0A7R9KW97_9ACAR|nr:unnamed protein product [Medioppia subpectinata]CAG2110903.1 unnamed protein product [Medioppia subpectinata]
MFSIELNCNLQTISREMSDKSVEPLAVTRERRANAGAKMSSLLDREEVVDDFYKTTYGGFEEEAEDNDYLSDESDSHDEIDSDFSIDENDEPISDDNEEGERKRRMKSKSVYKEPKPVAKKAVPTKPSVSVKSEAGTSGTSGQSAGSSTRSGGARRPPSLGALSSPTKSRISPKKWFRESTRKNARETEHRLRVAKKESEMRRKSGRNAVPQYRQLTQQEMLKESRKTEALNLKSLERYRKLELEKSKKIKLVKESPKGPYVRYQSVAMPLIQELPQQTTQTNPNPTQQLNEEKVLNEEPVEPRECVSGKCCRTFISFTDDKTFKEYFPERRQPVVKQKLYCPISHLPGRYFDPVTLLPYSSAATFRAIREAYYKQLEQLGDQRQPEVAKWVQWRKRTAAQRPNIHPRIIRIIK